MTIAGTNGINLNFDQYGKGEPVIMVAGTGSPGRVWKSFQVPALMAAGYQVFTFDSRGVPPSDACLDGFTLDDMVADTAALIEHLGVGRCRIVGFSLGAIIVQELLLARPDLVSQAVLMATRGRTDELSTTLSLAEMELLDAGVKLPWRYAAYVRLIQGFSARTLTDDQRVRDWLDVFELAPPDASLSREQLEVDMIPNRLGEYPAITTPCLVIGFTDDLIMPPQLGQEVADRIPGSRYLEIPDCGHYGYLERPTTVNEAIVEFFAQG